MTDNATKETQDIQEMLDKAMDELNAIGTGEASHVAIKTPAPRYPDAHYDAILQGELTVAHLMHLREQLSKSESDRHIEESDRNIADAIRHIDCLAAVDPDYLSAEETIGMRRVNDLSAHTGAIPGVDILNCPPQIRHYLQQAAAAEPDLLAGLIDQIRAVSDLLASMATIRPHAQRNSPAPLGARDPNIMNFESSKPRTVEPGRLALSRLRVAGRVLAGAWRMLSGQSLQPTRAEVGEMVRLPDARYFITSRNGAFYLGEVSLSPSRTAGGNTHDVAYTALRYVGPAAMVLYLGQVGFGQRVRDFVCRSQPASRIERLRKRWNARK